MSQIWIQKPSSLTTKDKPGPLIFITGTIMTFKEVCAKMDDKIQASFDDLPTDVSWFLAETMVNFFVPVGKDGPLPSLTLLMHPNVKTEMLEAGVTFAILSESDRLGDETYTMQLIGIEGAETTTAIMVTVQP